MDLSYGITCRRNNTKRVLFAFLHFYDVHPNESGLLISTTGP
jgi:hypothetical protein